MLIGLSGKKGSGKDTAYRFIQDWGNGNYVAVRRDAFADRLKLSAVRLFNPKATIEDAIRWADGLKAGNQIAVLNRHGQTLHNLTGRTFLQRYGTEAHRDVFGHDFWLVAVAEAYKGSKQTYDITVITDVRFDNEAELVHELGGEVWEIIRPGDDDGDAHASEVPISQDLVDISIVNDGDLDYFQAQVVAQIGTKV